MKKLNPSITPEVRDQLKRSMKVSAEVKLKWLADANEFVRAVQKARKKK